MNLSNKSLALMLTLAIVVSIGGTTISLVRLNQVSFTGFALSDTGLANVSILSSSSIVFDIDVINFGSGYTNDTSGAIEYCHMVTNGTYNGHDGPEGAPNDDCAGFNATINQSNGFILRNDGNQDVSLNISSDSNAASFITGTVPGFNWSLKDKPGEPGSCTATPFPSTYSTVNITNTTACVDFNSDPSNDELVMDLLVKIPDDATAGIRTATITAYAY